MHCTVSIVYWSTDEVVIPRLRKHWAEWSVVTRDYATTSSYTLWPPITGQKRMSDA